MYECQILTVKDLMEMLKVGRDKACQIQREVRSYCNSMYMKGKIFKSDFEKWKNRQ